MKVIVDSKDGEKAGSGALLNARGVFHTCFFALALGAQSGFSRVMKVSRKSATKQILDKAKSQICKQLESKMMEGIRQPLIRRNPEAVNGGREGYRRRLNPA